MSDINKRIAVEVMGWRLVDYTEQGLKYHSDSKWVENDPPIHGDGYIQYRGGRRMSEFDFKPDTDMNDAMMVVDKMREDGYEFVLTDCEYPDKSYQMEFAKSINETQGYFGTADKPALAISLAALKVKESLATLVY